MTPAAIIALRLRAQRLVDPPLADPVAVVRRLGAVQSQEFQFAKWTLAQRTAGATDVAIDDLFNTGQIVRTHIMRPTWHFVAPEDLRWLLDLTGQRVQQVNGTVYRQKDLDAAALARGDDVIRQALQGNRYLTRLELGDHLAAAGLWIGDNVQLAYLVMHAEKASSATVPCGANGTRTR